MSRTVNKESRQSSPSYRDGPTGEQSRLGSKASEGESSSQQAARHPPVSHDGSSSQGAAQASQASQSGSGSQQASKNPTASQSGLSSQQAARKAQTSPKGSNPQQSARNLPAAQSQTGSSSQPAAGNPRTSQTGSSSQRGARNPQAFQSGSSHQRQAVRDLRDPATRRAQQRRSALNLRARMNGLLEEERAASGIPRSESDSTNQARAAAAALTAERTVGFRFTTTLSLTPVLRLFPAEAESGLLYLRIFISQYHKQIPEADTHRKFEVRTAREMCDHKYNTWCLSETSSQATSQGLLKSKSTLFPWKIQRA